MLDLMWDFTLGFWLNFILGSSRIYNWTQVYANVNANVKANATKCHSIH